MFLGGIAKEGSCPYVDNQDECPFQTKLAFRCLRDSDCEGELKCCPQDCKLQCVPPVKSDKGANTPSKN